MSLINPHSAPLTPTVPSMRTLQACSTRFKKGTNYVVNNDFAMATKPDLAMHYHRAAFSLVSTTFISAINKGYLSTWSGLTAELITKHIPKSLVTAKGHNKLARQNVRSTRPQDTEILLGTCSLRQLIVLRKGGVCTYGLGRFLLPGQRKACLL